MAYTPVTDIADIDLTRHALIEASAGTGKTYTLENLVVRLLRERADVALENILIVTFTEKATSELKIRIQEKLAEELRAVDPPSATGARQEKKLSDAAAQIARKFRETLDAFDMAAIHTIHGFCHTILQDFAFENQTLFQNELVDDGPLFDTLIREQLRRDWPAVYGDRLAEVLQLADFGARREGFLAQVSAIARNVYRPGVGDILRPDIAGRTYEHKRADLIERAMALKALVGSPPSFSQGFGRLNINAAARKSLLAKMVEPLEAFLAAPIALPALADLIARLEAVDSSGRRGIQCLVPEKWNKGGPNLEVCPNLVAVAAGLTQLAAGLTRLRHILAVDTIHRLQAEAVRTKGQHGWISYDDMLSRVNAALQGPRGEDLVHTLRGRYKIAFVDEFQDTDPVQWRIFRRIFLDQAAEATENRLFLIGDPKQAIYSFRGADVFAYLDARRTMLDLAGQGRAALYSLAVNWRSTPHLTDTFNTLFSRSEWFPPQDSAGPFEIGYQAVASPDEADLPESLAADGSSRPALNVVDLGDSASPAPAKPVLARFIAREIRHLMAPDTVAIRTRGSAVRPLDYGDICLLVRGKAEAAFLEEALAEQGIPFSFYKKPGLFLSDEALYLSLTARAVLDPGNAADVKKALLTPFFDYQAGDLPAYETLPVSHPLKQLLMHWHDLAHRRRWGALFQSLLEDSGLLFRRSADRNWDRTHTNFRQIFEHLEAAAYRGNLDFRGLSALLDSYRKQTLAAGDEADIHQIETEARKVQIMTIHVSKGLQFPVVFVAGGLTQHAGDDYHVYHVFDPAAPESGIHKEIDLSATIDPERHEQEKNEEDKRLYYVALTRAQFKLYVPFHPAGGNHRWLGPICRFVSPALAAAFPRTRAAAPAAVAWLTPPDTGPAAVDAPAPQPETMADPTDRIHPLLPEAADYSHRKILLESFSSLQARRDHGPAAPAGEARYQVRPSSDRDDDEPFALIQPGSLQALRPEDELRGGADVGSMFHDILERIDYAAVLENPGRLPETPATAAVITDAMAAYRIEPHWQHQIGRIVSDTLTTPINGLDVPLTLGALKKEDRLHEVEFYYPLDPTDGPAPAVAECNHVGGRRCYIRGFVDLVFRHNGKYFIADWKSNRLDDGYGPESLEACMDAAGYHLQYQLYTIAVQRWLKQVLGGRYDPDTHFGGVFYFFIRGIGSGTSPDNGIYHVPAAKALKTGTLTGTSQTGTAARRQDDSDRER